MNAARLHKTAADVRYGACRSKAHHHRFVHRQSPAAERVRPIRRSSRTDHQAARSINRYGASRLAKVSRTKVADNKLIVHDELPGIDQIKRAAAIGQSTEPKRLRDRVHAAVLRKRSRGRRAD